jgi:signal transduction histidine kinase
LREAGFQWFVDSAGALSVLVVALPLLMITTVLFTEIFAMPALIRYVGERHYTHLEQRRGGTVLGSTLNALASITIFLVLWIVTLPLWLTGIAGAVLPPLLSAFLAQRVFRYDALSDHAGAEEYRAIVRGARGRLLMLGLLLAPLIYVPVLNLFAPALSALAFTHFCLCELAVLREKERLPPGASRT